MSVDLSKRCTSLVQFISTAILIQKNCTLWEFNHFSAKDTVPPWWVTQQSYRLEDLTANLVGETIKINTIFPKAKADIKQRASHIQKAISLCFEIVQHINYIIGILSMSKRCNLGESLKIEALVKSEISLLKGLRRSDKERFA